MWPINKHGQVGKSPWSHGCMTPWNTQISMCKTQYRYGSGYLVAIVSWDIQRTDTNWNRKVVFVLAITLVCILWNCQFFVKLNSQARGMVSGYFIIYVNCKLWLGWYLFYETDSFVCYNHQLYMPAVRTNLSTNYFYKSRIKKLYKQIEGKGNKQ
jgi:hypothetical protein